MDYMIGLSFLKSFLGGVLVGISVALPVGPIGILCIKKTLELGVWGAFGVAFGVASADALYALVAIAGLGALSSFLLGINSWIQLLGGLFLIALGINEFFSPYVPGDLDPTTVNNTDIVVLGAKTALIALTNPSTILVFVGVFSLIGRWNPGGIFNSLLVMSPLSISSQLSIVAGIFSGSFSWFMFLGYITSKFHRHVHGNLLKNIHYFSASILVGFGMWAFMVWAYLHITFFKWW